MNCAQFLASDAAQDRAQVLALLKANIPTAEYAPIDNDAIPLDALVAILKGKSEQIDKSLEEARRKAEAEGAWDKLLSEKDEGEAPAKMLVKRAKKIGGKTKLGTTYDGTGDDKKISGACLEIYNPHLIQLALRAMEEEQTKVLEEAKAPKSKKKASGRRTKKADADYEIEYLNDRDDAQGAEYEYFLTKDDGTTDEKALIAKDQKISKDGTKKSKRWKAVRKEKPFYQEGTCQAAITWDRAGGSEVLKAWEIAGSFRMCCSEKHEDGRKYCSKHLASQEKKGKKFEDFFDGEYKSGELKGVGWADFLIDKCGPCAVKVE